MLIHQTNNNETCSKSIKDIQIETVENNAIHGGQGARACVLSFCCIFLVYSFCNGMKNLPLLLA